MHVTVSQILAQNSRAELLQLAEYFHRLETRLSPTLFDRFAHSWSSFIDELDFDDGGPRHSQHLNNCTFFRAFGRIVVSTFAIPF
jgi:hypothetical protein